MPATRYSLHQMAREHQAWIAFMNEFMAVCPNVDFNETHALHACITLWGEELYWLRRNQEDTVVVKAYQEAVARFEKYVGPRDEPW